jgi:endo-1,4-beta-xylanase
MKFKMIHPRPGPQGYAFSEADAIVAFAQQNGQKVRGHTLVWYEEVPQWVDGLQGDALEQALHDHITTVVGRYRGRVYAWDVANEVLDDHGNPRDFAWSRVPDYLAKAYTWAHEADPDAKLFYNDYDLESRPDKADAVYKMIQGLKARGVPIQGVGLQTHLDMVTLPYPYADFKQLIQRFAGLGVEVHVTELDVLVESPLLESVESSQAELYRRVLDGCLAVSACKAFVMWGVMDSYSWRPDFAPDIFDAAGRPKPAFWALADGLAPRRQSPPQTKRAVNSPALDALRAAAPR